MVYDVVFKSGGKVTKHVIIHRFPCLRTSNFWEGRTVMSQFWLHMDHSISQLVPIILRENSIKCIGNNFEGSKY